jgi:hypothetical protein
MMLLGFAGLGFAGYRRPKQTTQLPRANSADLRRKPNRRLEPAP